MNRFITIVFLILSVVASSFADRRNYVWTYQYTTLPQDFTELEFYQTTKVGAIDKWEYRIEVEQGITDHFDISIYQIFTQNEGESLKWNAVQFRSRYRFGEQGEYLVDPLLYFEYNRKLDLDAPHKLEGKLILAKTLGRLNVALNPVYEIFFNPGTEHELGLDGGLSWQFSPHFIAGLETTSRLEFEDGEQKVGSYLGPTVSLASGKWWYAAGAAFGLTAHSDDVRVRFIMGIEL